MNFDRIAPYYDTIASVVFFGAIKRSQIKNLRTALPKGKVLVIGGGSGWIIPYIFESGQVERLYYIEASHKMLGRSKINCPIELQSKVEFVFGDENTIPHLEFDAVITNFFLDCFEEDRLNKVTRLLYERLKPSGMWYWTDFRIDDYWFYKLWQLPLVWLMYFFFNKTVDLESSQLIDFEKRFNQMELINRRFFAFKSIISSQHRKGVV